MIKRGDITELLIIEHGRMRELLARFIREIERSKGQKDKKNLTRAFDLFSKKERNHVFIEENKIFNLNMPFKKELVKTLVKQHVESSKMIKDIKDLIKNGDPTAIAFKLEDFLKMHTNLEEKDFYPVLDKNMSAEKKPEFIEDIRNRFGKELD
jgi:hemerythrin-like domain-containing protein